MIQDVRSSRNVAARSLPGAIRYPALDAAPYHPSEKYPEYRGAISAAPNDVYAAVRMALADLGLDRARFSTPDWNPIDELVRPGAKIVVKPNWVLHRNEKPGGGTDELITHASVLRAVLDYVWLARPREVVVGDAPIQVCDFSALQQLGFAHVAHYFHSQKRPLMVKDFRRTVMVRDSARAEVSEDRRPLDEFTEIDLGRDSFLEPISGDAEKFRVTMYDPRKMIRNHAPGVHKYLVAGDVLDADLVINVPKMKTHKKAGVTLALKNLVGINGNKDYLPHHRKGAGNRGGDNYERSSLPKRVAESMLDFANRHLDKPLFYRQSTQMIYKLLFFDRIRGLTTDIEGGWHGNDTVWRMCLDLNKVLLYADRAGRLHDIPQRAVLHITDGVIAGDGDGPLRPDAVAMGVILAAQNAAAHDWVATKLMGLDPARIPINRHAFESMSRPLADFSPDEIKTIGDVVPRDFKTSAGWRGHIESAQRS